MPTTPAAISSSSSRPAVRSSDPRRTRRGFPASTSASPRATAFGSATPRRWCTRHRDIPRATSAIGSSKPRALFCADTLFSLGCGRLFEGTPELMWRSLSKFAPLPDDAMVYCAHEYTQSNARFALSVDPDNPTLQARAAEVERLRAAGQPTVPSTLGDERAANPFLRPHDPAIRRRLGMERRRRRRGVRRAAPAQGLLLARAARGPAAGRWPCRLGCGGLSAQTCRYGSSSRRWPISASISRRSSTRKRSTASRKPGSRIQWAL